MRTFARQSDTAQSWSPVGAASRAAPRAADDEFAHHRTRGLGIVRFRGGRCQRPRAPGHRAGLSLIEVLISLALSGILLTAIYSAINMYFHYSTSGQEEIERVQMARVLMKQIETDLRSIVYSAESGKSEADDTTASDPSATDDTSGNNSSTTSTTTAEQKVTDPSDAFGGSASGLFGDGQTIVLHVSRPSKNLLSAPQLNGPIVVSRTSDLKTVSYFVAGNGSGGLQAAAASHFATQSRGKSSGLARMEGDRLALQLADKSGNVASLLGQTQMLAPEVTRIGFRYYDGTVWTTQWDSANFGGLPRAVEVTLEITDPAADPNQSRFKKSSAPPAPRTYKTIVPLPLSKPIMSSTT